MMSRKHPQRTGRSKPKTQPTTGRMLPVTLLPGLVSVIVAADTLTIALDPPNLSGYHLSTPHSNAV
jgi:hypothetical protein